MKMWLALMLLLAFCIAADLKAQVAIDSIIGERTVAHPMTIFARASGSPVRVYIEFSKGGTSYRDVYGGQQSTDAIWGFQLPSAGTHTIRVWAVGQNGEIIGRDSALIEVAPASINSTMVGGIWQSVERRDVEGGRHPFTEMTIQIFSSGEYIATSGGHWDWFKSGGYRWDDYRYTLVMDGTFYSSRQEIWYEEGSDMLWLKLNDDSFTFKRIAQSVIQDLRPTRRA